jgi:hypothetical protein
MRPSYGLTCGNVVPPVTYSSAARQLDAEPAGKPSSWSLIGWFCLRRFRARIDPDRPALLGGGDIVEN